MKKHQKPSKLKIFGAIIGLLFVYNVTIAHVANFVSAPTASHRETAKEISDLTYRTFGEPGQTPEEEKRLAALSNSPESQYSIISAVVFAIINLVINYFVVYYTFKYLRGNRIVGNPVGTTILVDTVALLLALWPIKLVTMLYMGFQGAEQFGLIYILPEAVLATIVNVIVVFIMAKIAESYYNRNHGFSD